MKVLVAGGYGFLGSHIAEKLIKERHKVTIVDDLTRGDKDNVKLNHNSVVLDVTSPRLQKIYDEEQFDVVVYAVNQKSIMTNISNVHSKTSDIAGLRHLLELAHHYKSKRFIFLSSYDVYKLTGDSIDEDSEVTQNSELACDYLYQEKLCKDYSRKGLTVNILRLSNVYGPKLIDDNSNLMSMIGYHYKKNEDVKIDTKANLYQDYIYVGDLADAVLKTMDNVAPHILNISSNEKTTNKMIEEALNNKLGELPMGESEPNTVFLDSKLPNISYTFDNRLAYETIGWYPKTSFEDGIIKYGDWLNNYESKKIKNDPVEIIKDEEKTFWQKLYPFLENIALFIMFYLVNLFFRDVLKLNVDIMIIYIVIISTFYGLSQGSIAVVLSSIVLIMHKLSEGSDIAYLLFDLDNIFYLSIYFLIGILTGYSIDKEKYKSRLTEYDKADLKSELDFVSSVYDKSIRIKNALQYDIENYEDSFGKVFDITDRLNKVDVEEVYNEAAKVIARIMKADSVTVLHLDPSGYYSRVMSVYGKEKFGKSLKVSEYKFLEHVVTKKQMYVNNKMEKGFPVMAAPITYNEEVAAIVLIDDVDFNNLSLHYVNMLRVVTLLTSNAIGSANIYQNLLESEKYYENTQILKPEWFKKVIDIKNRAAQDNLSTNFLVKLDMTLEEGIENYEKLSKLVRNFDYIGLNDKNKLEVLFSNAKSEDRETLYKRFQDNGLKVIKEVS